jgi:hypothetical protein
LFGGDHEHKATQGLEGRAALVPIDHDQRRRGGSERRAHLCCRGANRRRQAGAGKPRKHQPIWSEVKQQYVNRHAPPASTTVQVSALTREGALLEVEAVAALPA